MVVVVIGETGARESFFIFGGRKLCQVVILRAVKFDWADLENMLN